MHVGNDARMELGGLERNVREVELDCVEVERGVEVCLHFEPR